MIRLNGRAFGWVIPLVLLASCAGDRRKAETSPASAAREDASAEAADSLIQRLPQWDSSGFQPASFTTEMFAGVPKEVDGCTGLFAADNESLLSGNYLFVTDLQERGFLKVNGEMVRLQREAYKLAEGAIVEIYTGGGFRVEVDVRRVAQLGDEVWLYSGTVRVIRGREQQLLQVSGEVGC